MGSPERPAPSVARSMEAAEVRVEAGKVNVAQQTKEQIVKLETGVKTQIENFKKMGIYEGVKADFVDVQMAERDTPEFLLANMAFRFDRMQASENAAEGEALRVLASETLSKLNQMKGELSTAAGA